MSEKTTLQKIKSFLYNFKIFAYFLDIRKDYIDKKINTENERKDRLWQSKFKDGNTFFVMQLQDNISINLYKNSLLSKLIFEGNFELNEINFLKKFLKKEDYFLDIGANIGLFSINASRIIGENGKIISFEPSPVTFSRLKENIELNKFTNVDIRNIGISDKKGELTLNISETGHDAWDTFATNIDKKMFNNSATVPVHTLDDELKEIDKERISLVKIDVEGWEKFVLNGAKEFLTKYEPVLMVEFTENNTEAAGYNVLELYDIMSSFGYKWYKYINGNLIPEKRNKRYVYDNLIAIKNIQKVNSRLS